MLQFYSIPKHPSNTNHIPSNHILDETGGGGEVEGIVRGGEWQWTFLT
jgi:hypothetical protein